MTKELLVKHGTYGIILVNRGNEIYTIYDAENKNFLCNAKTIQPLLKDIPAYLGFDPSRDKKVIAKIEKAWSEEKTNVIV